MNQRIQIISILLLLLFAVGTYTLSLRPPLDFPIGEKFPINEGENLYSISKRLEEKNIISSALLFRGWVSMTKRDKHVGLGVYEFDKELTLGGVVAKIIEGPDEPLLSVTIPEGYTTKQIADAYKKALPAFSPDLFGEVVHKEKLDGYLFPSTYYPLPSYTESDIAAAMKAEFDKMYAKNFADRSYPRHVSTKQDVVSLAAILEGEAKTEEDMKIVSGILQKRLEKGMRLQVDVSEMTYDSNGLPQTPINNPGAVAINAVFDPITTEYLYYLTGKDGTMHYAKNYEDHKRNIQKYLR